MINDSAGTWSGDAQYNGGRNKRSVWTVATAPYPEAHFATYPPDLIKPCIMAGTSAKGCCAKCGAPWERVVELTDEYRALLDSGKAWRDDTGKPDGFVNRQPNGSSIASPTKEQNPRLATDLRMLQLQVVRITGRRNHSLHGT